MFDFARRWLAVIQAQLQKLDRNQKLLIGALAIIVAMALFLVMQYSAAPELRLLMRLPSDAGERTQLITYLDNNNVNYKLQGEQVFVEPDKREKIMAELAVNNMLPQGEDMNQVFQDLIEDQKWYLNSEQNKQKYMVALQTFMGMVVGEINGVERASVVVADPQFRRVGQPNTKPSASVTVFMESGQRLNSRVAMSIAGLVAGGVPGMDIGQVKVVDATTGKMFDGGNRDAMIGGDLFENKMHLENQYREKVEQVIVIPESVVAVNVTLSRASRQRDDYDVKRDNTVGIPNREITEDFESNSEQPGGIPGSGSMMRASVEDSTGRTRTTRSTTDTTLTTDHGRTRDVAHIPAGAERQVNITVNVPHSYLVGLYRKQTGETDEPTEEQLQPIRDRVLNNVKAMVDNLLKQDSDNIATGENVRAGSVMVSSYYDVSLLPGVEDEVAQAGVYPTLFGLPIMGSTWWLILLAVVSVGMMLLMVYRASRRPVMPSIHELAGIPETPPLMPEADELVGELGDAGGVLEGLELDDEDMRREKILSQVRELIEEHPEEAAMLVTRWASQNG